jgi:hypothetical protein
MEAFSQTCALVMNDVTLNDNNENGYEVDKITGSKDQRTDTRE